MKPTRSTIAEIPEDEPEGLLARHPSILSLGVLLVAVAAFFWWATGQELGELEARNRTAASDAGAKVLRLLVDQRARMIAASPVLELRLIRSGLLAPGTVFDRQAVERLFIDFLTGRPEISQLRWIDANGMERARVNQPGSNDGKNQPQMADELQDKSDREYFRDALNLQAGDVYLSHLELNREFGVIALPIEPTLRTAVPTNTSLGLTNGVLVVNFNLSSVITELIEAARAHGAALDLLDASNGKIYASSLHPDLEWAHELQNPPVYYGDVYPERFRQMNQYLSTGSPSTRLQTGLLLRTDTISNFRVTDGTLVAYTFVPAENIIADRQHILIRLSGLAALVLAAGCLLLFRIFRLEQKKFESLRQMQELASAKSQFLANMSHEIRTPITGIMGMLDLVLTEVEEPNQKEKLRFVQESTRSLRQIVDDILHVSKLQGGMVDLESRVFRPARTLERVARLYGAPARLKGIEITSVVPDTLADTVVLGDEFRIEQVLNNLVSNAIKFTEKGCVSLKILELERSHDRVILSFRVRDSGIGIDPATIDQLCQPFVQADVSTTRKYGGTGLGLSICNGLLILMDSELNISSEPGVGSEFSFDLDLPLASVEAGGGPPELETSGAGTSNEPVPMASVLQASEAPLLGPETKGSAVEDPDAVRDKLTRELKRAVAIHGPPQVLVTEDSIAMQVLLRALFENLDIPITVAENGRDALDLIDIRPFDLVFMDLQMPVMGGIEAISIIRQRFTAEQLPIIVLSAVAGREELDDSKAAGGDHCLHKPIDIVSLLATVLHYWKPGGSRLDRAPGQRPETGQNE